MSVAEALNVNQNRSIRLTLPSLIPKALGFAACLPIRCLEQIPVIGKAGVSAAVQYNVVPISITIYAVSLLIKRLRKKPAQPITTETDEEVLDMVKDLDSAGAAAQLESLRVKMLEAMVDSLLKSMLEDTLSSTLSLPFTQQDIEVVRAEMELRLSTLQTLYGADVIDVVVEKLERQKAWTKSITDQVNSTDINNPRLNFPQPKALEDPQEWVSQLKLKE